MVLGGRPRAKRIHACLLRGPSWPSHVLRVESLPCGLSDGSMREIKGHVTSTPSRMMSSANTVGRFPRDLR